MAKTVVYVDGFNLYYGALKRTPYKWLDLGQLCRQMLQNDDIVAINIATHLVRDGSLKRFDVAVFITNDSDLAEPVRIVRQEFGMPVGILNPHQHHSVQLKRLATFLKRIRQSHLIAGQFPENLRDAKGAFHKPANW